MESIAATATGYSRAAGSFITDGLCEGMEITPIGFSTNTVDTIESLTATTITTKNARTAEAAASGRSFSVLLPASFATENSGFVPEEGVPWVEEQYAPGGVEKITLGALGELEALPVYFPRVYVPADTGRGAASKYADAILALFAADTNITMTAPATLRVKGRPAPALGQLLQVKPGFAMIPVAISLLYRTPNPI